MSAEQQLGNEASSEWSSVLAVAAEEEAREKEEREAQVARDAELARRGSAEGGGENEAPSMVASTIGTASIMGNTTLPKSALENLAADRVPHLRMGGALSYLFRGMPVPRDACSEGFVCPRRLLCLWQVRAALRRDGRS